MTIAFSQSAAQQADLQQLLEAQQSPASPQYHQWLTPAEYAQRFGVSEDDLAKVTAWAQGEGLTLGSVARGRNWVTVSGSAAQVENAFHTSIHQYVVDGETHFANSTEPSVPAAIGGIVKAIRGLNDFRAKPAIREPRNPLPAGALDPRYTSTTTGSHYLAPGDFAAIYNVAPLYGAGIGGAGQKLVVVGQTKVNLSDIEAFRAKYGLSTNDPQITLVPGSRDPGIRSTDLPEADLDLEWSGAVARDATILYVYAYDVMQATQYAIDQNLAPVVSMSYGACELETATSDASTFRSWAQQANAQGITWFAASGDHGGADCGDTTNPGLAVDVPASIPEVTGVGGTEFVEGSGTYWRATNDAGGASALGPIPETTWNDSALDGTPSAGGGGASVRFAKPAWQTGPGVPSDNARHVPDIAMTASANHDAYLVYSSGQLQAYGGTSAPTPAFAGIATLMNQYLVSSGAQQSAGLGNINPRLYALAQSNPAIFRDVTTGDNIVTVSCSARSRTCTNSPVGYSAGANYDSATGLGSVDAYKLAAGWSGTTFTAPTPTSSTVRLTLLSNLSSLGTSDSIYVTATATSTDGATPAGVVTFSAGAVSLGSVTLTGSAGISTATIALAGSQFPLGGTTITATYSAGSASSVNASVNVTVGAKASGPAAPVIWGSTNAGSYRLVYAPGMILSVFGSDLALATDLAATVPLPNVMDGVEVLVNGVSAPVWYVSPSQLNIQIPYETAAGAPAVMSVNNNGQVVSSSLAVAAAAPGIFTDQNSLVVPVSSVTRGQVITLYFTGAGAVSPAIATGAAPAADAVVASLPVPTQTVVVTVGGVAALIDFAGIPPSLVGCEQLNFTVPPNAPLGMQPVVVSVGGVNSAPAYLNIGG